ncbi:hypothetical protein ASPZODRAFT_149218 [Penicilliopsis zonata CBS 506.65]|uniref:Vesicle-mediated transporter Vid24 n=1 Tax=Penicilliopsis zonata CBS 506.65 TaxID=1073090 RepID=A0A1L9SR81_9EURO|nr:hypothetical protein ASPZODRAFT_149218 [Penicilliopsis zonata CBS 506.65]OJJ49732.1 hypothetical protein ASPZODRAFT_149218 [Penicilliopsis zonata CBS 506.65]
MPTPRDHHTLQLAATPTAEDASTRTTCPPETDRFLSWRELEGDVGIGAAADAAAAAAAQETAPSPTAALSASDDGAALSPTQSLEGKPAKPAATPDEEAVARRASPSNESSRSLSPAIPVTAPSTASLLSYEFSNLRLLPNHTSSFLRAGSKFVGTQQSDQQIYNVNVDIKHVDMTESYLCGYLCIQGLTQDHPTLTTFFEGEMIGPKYNFLTRNESWGATEKTDMLHWARFPAWKPLVKHAKRPDFTHRNFAQRDHIFMRWKEYFLVPDHRVKSISGASFDGFYYICFNQVEGTVSGIYFHSQSEKFQQLELKHVKDCGCAPAMEFR